MLDIRLQNMTLAAQLREIITIRRRALSREYDPNDADTYELLAENVFAVIRQNPNPELVLPSGEVIQQSEFKCFLYDPLPEVEVGDIVERVGKDRLYVDAAPPPTVNIHKLGLSSRVK